MPEPKPDFYVDPRNKLGADESWADGEDFDAFVSNLNSGAVVRGNGMERVAELPRENELDAAALSQLRDTLSRYR